MCQLSIIGVLSAISGLYYADQVKSELKTYV